MEKKIKVLYSKETIEKRIEELAISIKNHFKKVDTLVCVGVLKGSIFFFCDLVRKIELDMAIDFIQVSSYRSGEEAGEIRIRKDIDVSIKDKHLLIIEDIIDTGITMKVILDLFKYRGAKEVKICALIDKPLARKTDLSVDFVGFKFLGKEFLVGYGLDLNEKYREKPFIGIIEGG